MGSKWLKEVLHPPPNYKIGHVERHLMRLVSSVASYYIYPQKEFCFISQFKGRHLAGRQSHQLQVPGHLHSRIFLHRNSKFGLRTHNQRRVCEHCSVNLWTDPNDDIPDKNDEHSWTQAWVWGLDKRPSGQLRWWHWLLLDIFTFILNLFEQRCQRNRLNCSNSIREFSAVHISWSSPTCCLFWVPYSSTSTCRF